MNNSYLADLKKAFKKTKGHYTGPAENALLLKQAESFGLLFHGSPNPNLMSGIALNKSAAMKNEAVVFAGKPWVAVSCTVKWSDYDFEQGARNYGTEPYMKAKHLASFQRYLPGGYVYAVSPETFEKSDGLTSFEFISRVPVKPLWVVFIHDPVSMMRELGVELIPKKTRLYYLEIKMAKQRNKKLALVLWFCTFALWRWFNK